jgi:hypothetical protein
MRMSSIKSQSSTASKNHSGTRLNTYLHQRHDELTKKFSQERNVGVLKKEVKVLKLDRCNILSMKKKK